MKRKGTFLLKFFLACMIGVFSAPSDSLAEYSILHYFGGGVDDGLTPSKSLTLSGSVLYGMTKFGGSSGDGVIFKVNTDGGAFTILHAFTGSDTDGAGPLGSLSLSGSTLYGVSASGGAYHPGGVLFSINTDGAGFRLLHSFGHSPDGSNPVGTPLLDGSVLYGMTHFGGDGEGTIYKINTDGSGYSILYGFKRTVSDGGMPNGSLIISGPTLYGMTAYGGSADRGTVFKINTDGGGYEVLHHFAGGATDGGSPNGALTLYNSRLYGMTSSGGTGNAGVVFSINTDGTDYQVVHWFGSIDYDGAGPSGSLILDGSTFYGLTGGGGSGNNGAIFQMNPDGADYKVIHMFKKDLSNDGDHPVGEVTFSNSKLYGMTTEGGGSGHIGTIFSMDTGLLQDATPTGDGWYSLGWFGAFNTAPLPWIYHETLGWLYPVATSTDSIWFYDAQWDGAGGWLWTSASAFPWFYSVNDQSWLYYGAWASTPHAFKRWFASPTGQWGTH